uniref:Uncharacterized protein n=1 Tax=Anopheles culicifacies TaxID=139723 RepID=A0A182MQX8_9DIPT
MATLPKDVTAGTDRLLQGTLSFGIQPADQTQQSVHLRSTEQSKRFGGLSDFVFVIIMAGTFSGLTTTPTPTVSVAGVGAGLLNKLERLVSSTVQHEARVYPVTVPSVGYRPSTVLSNVSEMSSSIPAATSPTVLTTVVQTDDFIVLPGPEDVLLFNTTTGLYQQSVTLTARMYPIEATAAKSIWGLPTLIWGILIGTVVILILILATLFFCCWVQPRTRKLLNSSYYTTTANNGHASQSSIVAKSCTSSDSNQLVMPLSIGICPPQYSAPPPPSNSTTTNTPQHTAASVIDDENDGDTNTTYRTRSLPSWGKNKQRPLSNADDLEELYAKVNFSKKRRNRMRNDEAAIIALCRSRSQNLAALPLATDQDAVVVYDERTAL